MSRFYGSMRGNRGEVTRQGSADSGITAHPRGWNTGIFVSGEPEDNEGRDRFDVYVSGGSNDRRGLHRIASIREMSAGIREVRFYDADGLTVGTLQV